jgi:hypothetical protein
MCFHDCMGESAGLSEFMTVNDELIKIIQSTIGTGSSLITHCVALRQA